MPFNHHYYRGARLICIILFVPSVTSQPHLNLKGGGGGGAKTVNSVRTYFGHYFNLIFSHIILVGFAPYGASHRLCRVSPPTIRGS